MRIDSRSIVDWEANPPVGPHREGARLAHQKVLAGQHSHVKTQHTVDVTTNGQHFTVHFAVKPNLKYFCCRTEIPVISRDRQCDGIKPGSRSYDAKFRNGTGTGIRFQEFSGTGTGPRLVLEERELTRIRLQIPGSQPPRNYPRFFWAILLAKIWGKYNSNSIIIRFSRNNFFTLNRFTLFEM